MGVDVAHKQVLAEAQELLWSKAGGWDELPEDALRARVASYTACLERICEALAGLGERCDDVIGKASNNDAAGGDGPQQEGNHNSQQRKQEREEDQAMEERDEEKQQQQENQSMEEDAKGAAEVAEPQRPAAGDNEVDAAKDQLGDVPALASHPAPVASVRPDIDAASKDDADKDTAPPRGDDAGKVVTNRVVTHRVGEEEVEVEEEVRVGSVDELDPAEWQVPPQCIPIHANVTAFDWPSLVRATQFDAIMMDPPWQLATANPTRGVALGYSQLTDEDIMAMPVPALQTDGYLFIWVINAKYQLTLDLFEHWGYTLVDEVVWVKTTVNRRLAKSHGFYLQHAKEVCLVGVKGNPESLHKDGVGSDIIFSERRGQSQKPQEIYELIEQLLPQGHYLEIFARKNNLRNHWVSLGNEVTGMGLPEKDMAALKDSMRKSGAAVGAAEEKKEGGAS